MLEGLREVGVGLGEVEGGDFAGMLELFPLFAGQLLVRIPRRSIFRFCRFPRLWPQDAEHVVRAEVGKEFFIEGGVGLLPEVPAFGNFYGVETEAVGQADGAMGAFGFVG